MIDQEQQRDYAEESYWRNYCPECDSPRCGVCHFEVSDGNADDPNYAYCGLPSTHAGEHGAWKV